MAAMLDNQPPRGIGGLLSDVLGRPSRGVKQGKQTGRGFKKIADMTPEQLAAHRARQAAEKAEVNRERNVVKVLCTETKKNGTESALREAIYDAGSDCECVDDVTDANLRCLFGDTAYSLEPDENERLLLRSIEYLQAKEIRMRKLTGDAVILIACAEIRERYLSHFGI